MDGSEPNGLIGRNLDSYSLIKTLISKVSFMLNNQQGHVA